MAIPRPPDRASLDELEARMTWLIGDGTPPPSPAQPPLSMGDAIAFDPSSTIVINLEFDADSLLLPRYPWPGELLDVLNGDAPLPPPVVPALSPLWSVLGRIEAEYADPVSLIRIEGV